MMNFATLLPKPPKQTVESVQTVAPSKRSYSLKSTATEAQYQRLIAMLRTGPKNTMEFRRAGVMAPAARIKELNVEYGYSIPTVARIDIWDEWGFPHRRIAVYALQAEPETVGAK